MTDRSDLPALADVTDRRGSSDHHFDDVFVEHFGRLVRSLTMITGDPARAEDAVQEAFHRAYARWRRIGRYDAPEAWIRKVAVNRARDLARSERRRLQREQKVASPHAVAGPEPRPDITAALDQLPVRQRTAVVLHYLDGLTVRETGRAMGITEGAVKYHLHQGRKGLAPLLEEEAT